jgi:GMP synthase (glutamine-hydrolysing)
VEKLCGQGHAAQRDLLFLSQVTRERLEELPTARYLPAAQGSRRAAEPRLRLRRLEHPLDLLRKPSSVPMRHQLPAAPAKLRARQWVGPLGQAAVEFGAAQPRAPPDGERGPCGSRRLAVRWDAPGLGHAARGIHAAIMRPGGKGRNAARHAISPGMRVLTIVHEAAAGPGVFARVAARSGDELVEWVPAEGSPPDGALEADAGVLVLGGSVHPDQESEHPWLRGEKRLIGGLLDRGVPLLGVCLGAELLAEVAGGANSRLPRPEIGWLETRLTEAGAEDPVLGGLPERFVGFQWHSYACEPPPGTVTLGGDGERLDAFRIGDAWGIQFHAEVTGEILTGWLKGHRDDPDAVAAGFDPAPVRELVPRRIAASEGVGAKLFAGFLRLLARRARS